MTLFLLNSDFWPTILLTTVYSAAKVELITDFKAKMFLTADFWPENLLITDFVGPPLRPSYYNEFSIYFC